MVNQPSNYDQRREALPEGISAVSVCNCTLVIWCLSKPSATE